MTDNGARLKSHRYRKALRMLAIMQKCTRPYTLRPNGEAERYVQASSREWAYHHSDERRKSLLLHHSNLCRIRKNPISRLAVNSLLRHDI
jgi:transposase InsO family protein